MFKKRLFIIIAGNYPVIVVHEVLTSQIQVITETNRLILERGFKSVGYKL